jgi:cell division topological specificity factor
VFESLKALLSGRTYSKSLAKNRLQMVLVQDRSGLNSDEMDYFKRDLLDVIAKYFVLERKNLDIEWQRSDNTTALIINTPVVGRPHSLAKAAGAS